MSEIDRLAETLRLYYRLTVSANGAFSFEAEAPALARALLRSLVGPPDWRIDTPAGKILMHQRHPGYAAACRQLNCSDDTFPGACAACADCGDHVIEAWVESILGES